MKKMFAIVKEIFQELKEAKAKNIYTPSYRVLEILQDGEGSYTVHMQVIGKSLTFRAKPEELLSEDKVVDQFSPRDVRTLTYLGYLGINAPKYKILAQRLIDDNKVVFAIQKRGAKEVLIKTAEQILQEKEIINSMRPDDAKTIGYRGGAENLQDEKNEMKIALKKSSEI